MLLTVSFDEVPENWASLCCKTVKDGTALVRTVGNAAKGWNPLTRYTLFS